MTYMYANGRKYVGIWVSSKMGDVGTITYMDCQKYVGSWVDGKMDGEGTMTYTDGQKYVGIWVKGKRHSEGKGCTIPIDMREDLMRRWLLRIAPPGIWAYADGTVAEHEPEQKSAEEVYSIEEEVSSNETEEDESNEEEADDEGSDKDDWLSGV